MQTNFMARTGPGIVAGVALIGLASQALADITGDPLSLSVSSAAGTGTWRVRATDGVWSADHQTWSYDGANDPRGHLDTTAGSTTFGRWVFDVRDSATSEIVATLPLDDISIEFQQDPQVILNIGVVAGAAATNFTISSALVSYGAIPNSIATASAGLSVTDRNGNGATLTGLYGGSNAYLAQYNGYVPGGSTFTTLVGPIAAGAFLTGSGSGNAGPTNIGTTSDMSAQWSFTLSARDSATGTSTYIITPAPGSMALLGVGGLLIGRRRR